ncbi:MULTISPECIES: hypothetical protein [Halobacillus]|uniref:Uncharacterized protein n=1 Tax=Halobacillus aidingensis TaxID=240303 RepID=A0A1H0IAT0_HALAD|nr:MULTISPECIES: hypothetical protein [Halobacillus]SDO28512.1 hypothetical protein SAMN05421677_10427 [Halobacillus aidingensis]
MSKNSESRKKNNPKGRDRGSANQKLQAALEGRNKDDDHLSAAYMNNNTAAVDVNEEQ